METPARGALNNLVARSEFGDAVGMEVAEIRAQTTPRTQRPCDSPEPKASWLNLAKAGCADIIAIVELHDLTLLDRFVQRIDQCARRRPVSWRKEVRAL